MWLQKGHYATKGVFYNDEGWPLWLFIIELEDEMRW
jgi:hypothetical protein